LDLNRFNKAQREAIETSDGPLLILAGPGTGKTAVLIGKIQRLIEMGVRADSILAVTFSRRATVEMQERLDRAIPGLSEQVNVSTLHAFCGDLVQRHGFRLGLQKRVRILSETDAKFFFRQMSTRLPLQPFLKTSHFTPIVDELLKLFQNLKIILNPQDKVLPILQLRI
jgi:DNA helicase-2/ATP-dependent DNA helicase PcrA